MQYDTKQEKVDDLCEIDQSVIIPYGDSHLHNIPIHYDIIVPKADRLFIQQGGISYITKTD